MSYLLQKRSAFIYGFEVTFENNKIDFNEGASDLVAEIDTGSYSLGRYVEKVAEALNTSGSNTYGVSVDRATRIITITSDSATDFLFETGNNASQNAAEMLGFDQTDLMAQTEITGDFEVGSVYLPQFWLQSYVPPENSVQAAFATKNKSASGRVQVQRFGTETFMECNINFATEIRQMNSGSPIEDNATGLADIRAFMNALIDQQPVEFYPDRDETSAYYRLILDSTPDSKDGTGFKLKEMADYKFRGYFETGKLVFRVTEE